jgi:hypothetical protein
MIFHCSCALCQSNKNFIFFNLYILTLWPLHEFVAKAIVNLHIFFRQSHNKSKKIPLKIVKIEKMLSFASSSACLTRPAHCAYYNFCSTR